MQFYIELYGKVLWLTKCQYQFNVCPLWAHILFKLSLPKKWHKVSCNLVSMMPCARSIILKSNWTIATSASFRLLSSSAGLIRVSTNSWSVGVEPYKLHLYYLILLLMIFTQNSTVLHGTVGSVSPSTRVDIKSSLRQIIAWIRHIHWSSKFRSCFIHLWKLWRVVFLLVSY